VQITEDRKKRVTDLYFNQHKTYAEIAEIERMSPRDIGPIIKEEQVRRQKYKLEKQQQEISSKAYKLFSEGKRPVDVAIALNLREPEATKLYREYWKLKRLHNLNLIYEELGEENIGYFVKLCKLAKKEGISLEQVIKLLQLADEDNPFGLPQLEKRRKWLIDEIHEFDIQIERSKKHFQSVNDEIASTKALLNSYHVLCEPKRQELERLNNEISRLEAFVSRFKSNNGEYLKIKQRVEEEVRNVLTHGKVLLQFALASIIEAIRRDPDKYNNLLIRNTSSTSTPPQGSLLLYIEGYRDMILEEANRLYDRLLKYFTDSIMDNAVGASSSSTFPNHSNKSDIYKIEGSEIYHNSKGDIAD
jgi:hypothetical protein